MREQLFDHVDIPKEKLPRSGWYCSGPRKVSEFTKKYEAEIEAAGGLDFQIAGYRGEWPHWV